MTDSLDLARFLIASWALTGSEPTMPVYDGLFDVALYNLQKENKLPQLFNKIYFSQARTGLKCIELPQILAHAEAAGFIQSTYSRYASVIITARAARILLKRLNISEEESINFGNNLRVSLKSCANMETLNDY